MTAAQPTRPGRSGSGRRLVIIGVVAVVAAIAVAAFLVWFVFFSTTAPPAPSIENAAGILSATPAPE